MRKVIGNNMACLAVGIVACGCSFFHIAEAAQHIEEQPAIVNNLTVDSYAHEANAIRSVTSIAQVYGDGEKVAAVAVEYPSELDGATLSPEDFVVSGKKVIAVFTNENRCIRKKTFQAAMQFCSLKT